MVSGTLRTTTGIHAGLLWNAVELNTLTSSGHQAVRRFCAAGKPTQPPTLHAMIAIRAERFTAMSDPSCFECSAKALCTDSQ